MDASAAQQNRVFIPDELLDEAIAATHHAAAEIERAEMTDWGFRGADLPPVPKNCDAAVQPKEDEHNAKTEAPIQKFSQLEILAKQEKKEENGWMMNKDAKAEAKKELKAEAKAEAKTGAKMEGIVNGGAPAKKEEENVGATVVTLYLPVELPPVPLGIGEIPSNYMTEDSRLELLNSCVKRHSKGSNGVRDDLMHSHSKTFVSGEIEGLFESHLLKAMYEEIRSTNKRTGRRRRRHNRAALKKAARENHKRSRGDDRRLGYGTEN